MSLLYFVLYLYAISLLYYAASFSEFFPAPNSLRMQLGIQLVHNHCASFLQCYHQNRQGCNHFLSSIRLCFKGKLIDLSIDRSLRKQVLAILIITITILTNGNDLVLYTFLDSTVSERQDESVPLNRIRSFTMNAMSGEEMAMSHNAQLFVDSSLQFQA